MADLPTHEVPAAAVAVVVDPPVDVNAAVQAALAAQQVQFKSQLKDATGFEDLKAFADARLQEQGKLQELADSKTAEAQSFKAKFEQSAIQTALLSAAQASVDSDTVVRLLAASAVCDEHGVVTMGGKPVSDAVTQLFADKPFLAKPAGGAGSGAPSSSPAGGVAVAGTEYLTPLQRLVAARQP